MNVRFGKIVFWGVSFFSLHVFATTKGLSQIVTPDLQAPADFSVSYQQQDASIGNPEQLQLELGLTPWLEVAAFQGFSPNASIFAAEIGLIQKEPYLLSTGFLNLSTVGDRAQPFLEGGYYTEHNKWMVGGISANSELEWLLGWAYDFDTHWRLQVDYQSGKSNFSTLGFTYTYNDSFQFNPAIYFPNDSQHSIVYYAVVTYTIPLWTAKKNPEAPSAL